MENMGLLEMQVSCAEIPDASIPVTATERCLTSASAGDQGKVCPEYLFFISTAALRLVKQAVCCQLKVGVQTDPRAVLGGIDTCAFHIKYKLPVQTHSSKNLCPLTLQ